MKQANILFSSTRQWNPGDELILHGIEQLLSDLGVQYNSVLYNRNPDIRTKLDHLNPIRYIERSFFGSSYLNSVFRFGVKDNSFKNTTETEFLDLVIFAGSPAWYSPNMRVLYNAIKEADLETMYIGIGSNGEFTKQDLPTGVRRTLRSSQLVVARDAYTSNELAQYDSKHLTCPSLFSMDEQRQVENIQDIGLVFMTDRAPAGNRVPPEFARQLIDSYRELLQSMNYRFDIICHYVDEVPHAHRVFDEERVRYSHNYQEYLSIYQDYDLVVSPRVHAVLPAASFGTPGLYLPHDFRSRTVNRVPGILKVRLNQNSLASTVQRMAENVSSLSERLIQHKRRERTKYMKHLEYSFKHTSSISLQ